MKELICIVCPRGCNLQVKDGVVSGHFCKRGITYALDELSNPVRMLTATLAITGGKISRLPVVTSKAINKNMLFAVLEELKKIELKAPITIGTVIVKNILNTGANIVATRTIE